MPLHEAVCGHVGGHRQCAGRAGDTHVDGEAVAAEPLGQVGELRGAGRRGEAQFVILVPDQVQQASGLRKGTASRGGDVGEQALCAAGIDADEVLCRGGLHDHRADRVRDLVVQLARDPVPLDAYGLAPDQLLLAFQLHGLIGELPGQPAEDVRRR